MLTEEQIEDIADANGHATVISYGRPAEREVIWYDGDMTPFARAIESTATAPLLARIAELTRELEEARKDAERYRFIRDADRSDCITRELSLYAMETLDEYVDAAMEDEARIAIDAAIKEQT